MLGKSSPYYDSSTTSNGSPAALQIYIKQRHTNNLQEQKMRGQPQRLRHKPMSTKLAMQSYCTVHM